MTSKNSRQFDNFYRTNVRPNERSRRTVQVRSGCGAETGHRWALPGFTIVGFSPTNVTCSIAYLRKLEDLTEPGTDGTFPVFVSGTNSRAPFRFLTLLLEDFL
jgi:hypothetical protein